MASDEQACDVVVREMLDKDPEVQSSPDLSESEIDT